MINYGRRIGSREKPAYGTVITDPFHPLSQGLVGYWMMNEGGGNRAYDISGHGNHGTLMNGPTWGGSKFGGGLSFDGSFDGTDVYVDCGNDESLDITDAITISVWVKFNDVNGYQYIINRGDGYFYRTYNDSKMHGFFRCTGGDIDVITSDILSIDVWYHIVTTYHSTNGAKIYVNGIEKGSVSALGLIQSSGTADLGIGKYIDYNQYYFNGTIDEVRIYNRALSAEEIKELYHDPFCNLLRVPIRRYSVAAAGGLTILDFERAGMRGVMRGIMRGVV